MKKGVLYPCFKHWEKKKTIWLYSDPHFGDEDARAFRKDFLGYDVDDDEQVRRINSKVGKDDIIIFLGDIGDTEYIKKIRGYKVLVMGNHDSGKSNYERVVTEIQTFDSSEIAPEDCSLIEDVWKRLQGKVANSFLKPFEKYFRTKREDNKLFDEVYDGPLTLNKKIILSHVPFSTEYFYNIHGHVHCGQASEELGINLCCELHDYYPINLNDIISSGKLKDVKNLNRQPIEKHLKEKDENKLYTQRCIVCGRTFTTEDPLQDVCVDCTDEWIDMCGCGDEDD